MNIVFIIFLGISIYLIVEKIYEQKIIERISRYLDTKNEFYYKEFLKRYEKSKKIKITEKFNLIYKINLLIDKADLEKSIFINVFSLIGEGICCFAILYITTLHIFKNSGVSLIIALPSILFPFVILKYIASYKSEKLEKVFLSFLLQLKNYTKISNDVIGALKNVETLQPLQSYIDKFNLELSSGIKFEKAMEHLKEKISVAQFREFFSNLEYCYVFGGDFTTLIEKSYHTINELQKEKIKRKQETQGARIVLFILILLNVFVYINFVKSDSENYMIMQNTLLGNIILYWNFLSIWILIYLSEKVKKLDY